MRIKRIISSIELKMWDASVQLTLLRDGRRNVDPYISRIRAFHRKLRIPVDYDRRGLIFYYEATDLIAVPCGRDSVHQWMSSAIQPQWLAMQAAAISDGLTFFVK